MSRRRQTQQNKDVVAAGAHWRKLEAPKRWTPEPGEMLTGKFLGLEERDGQFGSYNVALIKTEQGVFMASGVMLTEPLIGVMPGEIIHVIFGGRRYLDESRFIKMYDVYLAESNVKLQQQYA